MFSSILSVDEGVKNSQVGQPVSLKYTGGEERYRRWFWADSCRKEIDRCYNKGS